MVDEIKALHRARDNARGFAAAAGNVADTVRQAPEAVTRRTQGNPVAAGVIAFGVGLLAASLLPTTDAEKRAGQQLKEDVSGTVRDAAQQVKETARDAAQNTKEEAKWSAQDAKDQVRS